MLEGERSYQRGQENLVPSNNASPAPENPVIPKAQENPWYIRHFIKLLIGFGLGGGAVAILLPLLLWLHCGMSSGSSDQLRLHLLYVTGGIIAVLTLLQTNWKNQGDRLKIDADIKKNEQDAEKNERDHIRQVHAERRSRYTKAVEQLADEKATVRLGGVYTLVGLVDEWLTDNTLDPEEQQKEGQVIINNLCSYIRSPFPLAAKVEDLQSDVIPPNYVGDFVTDQATFREEQDVRRTIFAEMSNRSSILAKDENGEASVTPGFWSGFNIDFTWAPIFYPLDNLTIEKAIFSSAKFYGEANFFKTTFIQDTDFSRAVFTGYANFIGTTFRGNTDFSQATFTDEVIFNQATFIGDASFYLTFFTDNAHLSKATFTCSGDFSEAIFKAESYFYWTTFNGNTIFSRATFTSNVHFGWTTFTSTTEFIGSNFTGDVKFVGAIFLNFKPTFSAGKSHARFSTDASPQDYVFFVMPRSKRIGLGTATFLDKSFAIPCGAILYDPDSWDEEKQEYTRVSEPAKPLDESNGAEENKPE